METNEKMDKYLKRILNKTLLTYSFFEKSNEEIVNDAISRSENGLQEYSIYRLERFDKGTYQLPGKDDFVDSKYLILKPSVGNSSKFYKINISAFNFPNYFPFDFTNQFNNLYFRINDQSIIENKYLFDTLLTLKGQDVLITNCWDSNDKFGNFKKVFSIFTLNGDIDDTANLIVQNIAENRKNEINKIINEPIDYLTKYDMEIINLYSYNAANTNEFMEILRVELEKQLILVEEFINQNHYLFNNKLDCNSSPSDKELWEDTMNAMTDGNWNNMDCYNDDDDD